MVVLAHDEAGTFKHNYIGTEHLLLGLLREEEGLAARVLDSLDLSIVEVRAQVARIVGEGEEVATGHIPFTPRAKKVFELAFQYARSIGSKHVGTEHLLLGLAREGEGVAARIMLDLDAEPSTILNETLRMMSGPNRRHGAPSSRRRISVETNRGEARSMVTQRYDESSPWPRLLVACPACATPIQTINTDEHNAHLQVSIQGAHTCSRCGRRWAISVTAAWTDPSPPTDPDDDLGPEMTVWSHSQPAHFSMSCFRCDQALERITLDQTTTSPQHIEGEDDRPCPSCRKPWRISYDVSWEQQPSASSPPSG